MRPKSEFLSVHKVQPVEPTHSPAQKQDARVSTPTVITNPVSLRAGLDEDPGVDIQCRSLQFRYPDRRFGMELHDFDAVPGSAMALKGPSGCGKTTFLHLLAGILVPDCGSVLLDREDITRWSDRERRALRIRSMGLVFQQLELLDYLTVADNILAPVRLQPDGSIRTHRERMEELAAALDLTHLLATLPEALSQGERQRTAIARALIHRPRLVLADEPTGNLDPDRTHQAMQLLSDAAAEEDTTVVVVTHDPHCLEHFSPVVDFTGLVKNPVEPFAS